MTNLKCKKCGRVLLQNCEIGKIISASELVPENIKGDMPLAGDIFKGLTCNCGAFLRALTPDYLTEE